MSREDLGHTIRAYREQLLPRFYAGEEGSRSPQQVEVETLAGFSALLASETSCFHNDCFVPGHCTGSALVVDPTLSRVVLTFHRKVRRWLQLGGHADGHPRMHEVALREAREESGMEQFRFWQFSAEPLDTAPLPFDWDIHEIPARPGVPSHRHYDVRYLLVASGDLSLQISDESLDLRWFSLDELAGLELDNSVQRLITKLNLIRGWVRG
jgi:8-oxo-dGTP pyrophosphatase MutT (NUDIX family)